jgi:hypothetical protein
MEFAAAALATIASTIGGAGSSILGAVGLGGATTAAGAVSGGTAAAGAAAAGGGSSFLAALGLGGSSTAMQILSGGLSIGSALMKAQSGHAQALQYQLAAGEAEMDIGAQEILGLERRNALTRALLETVGERDVAAAASGVDLSFGTPAIARDQARTDTERALKLDQGSEDFRKARLKERARNFRMMASEAKQGAMLEAAGIAAQAGLNLLRQG